MSRYEDEIDQQFLEDTEDDLESPEDGRDGSPAEGSSDDPESLDAIDPLRRDTYLVDGDEDYNRIPDYQERGEYSEDDEPERDEDELAFEDDGSEAFRDPDNPDDDWTPRDLEDEDDDER